MPKITFNPPISFILAMVLLAAQQAGAAGLTTWSGAGGANQNWSAAANWTTVGGTTPPGATDIVMFRATGSGTAGTINNIVDLGFGGTIGSLIFTNELANEAHTTQIPTGTTLTISGPIVVGGTNQTATYTLTGGGTLRGGTGTSTFAVHNENGGTMTMDMSTLSNFVYNAGGAGANFNVGLDAGFNSGGVLKLAAISNNVTATTMFVGQNNNGGTAPILSLGSGTNIINANTIEVGWDKLSGTIQFNSATGGLRLRNAAGTGRTTFTIADHAHSGSASASATGNISLKGHYVDMLIGTLELANRHARTGGSSTALFSFDSGIVDVTNINMAINTAGGTNGFGTLSDGGGQLKVANNISLVNNPGNANNIGSLILTNGSLLTCGGSIIKSSLNGTGIVTVANSTVAFTSSTSTIGVPGQGVDTLNLSNAVIHLKLDNNAPVTSLVANTFNGTGSNTLVIDSVFNLGGAATGNYVIASYTGVDPFASFTGLSGTVTNLIVPPGYTASLLDDTGSSQIELSITAPLTRSLVWVGATNAVLVSNWQTNKATTNWMDASDLTPQAYANLDPVTFDDTAANSTVTLLTTNLPGSLSINNNSLNYLFNGGGKISGGTSLNKQGVGTLILSESGGDDFSGGIAINGGTLILDQTNSAISGGLTINSSTVQIGNNDGGGALPAGTLDDEGTLAFSRADNVSLSLSISGGGGLTQNGNGTLTLTSSNVYTGITVASRGTLALASGGSIVTSPGLLVSNATFDVSGIAGTTTLTDFSITNAHLNLSTTNLLTPIIVNTFEVDGIMASSNLINITTLPAVAIYPATFALIKSANPITLANGHFNFALGSPLPGGSIGSLSESADQTSVLLTLTSGPTGQRSSVTWAGVDNTSITTNWSDAVNWQLPGVPVSTDKVFFDNSTTVGAATIVNNFVDANFTVASLTYDNINGQFQVTQIPANTTLTASGTFTVGNVTADSAVTHVAFVDAGTLVVTANNGNLVGNSGSSGSSGNASLDLSGLSNFVYNASSATFGVGNLGSRGIGTFTLAGGSNSITAGTIAIMTSAASSSVSATSTLGAGTNNINASIINIAATRASGTLRFDPAVASGGLRLRGTGGTDTDRSTVVLGNRSSGGTSGTAAGTLALNDHVVDMKLATLTLGQCNQVSPVAGTGTLQFNQGTVDATGINMAVNSSSGSASGTITMGGGTLIVGSGGISLLNQSSTGTANGTLTFNNSTIICSNNIAKTTVLGTATISLTDSSLNLVSGAIGTLGAPIDTINLSDNGAFDTKIQLNVVAGVTNICATAVVINGGITTLNINSFAGLIGATQIPLVSYANGSSPIAGLKLGTTPAGYAIGNGGLLIDNMANQTIDILVTPPAPIIWVGAVGPVLNSSWDTSTLNWLNGVTHTAYADGNYVQLDDTTSNYVVTLTGTLSPSGVTVNNSTTNYAFNGSGKIHGAVSLVKEGSASLILDNSGANDFTAGVNIAGGTVQIGANDANGNLPATGNIIDNGTLTFNRTDSLTVSNLISGNGGVTQMGPGTNRFNALNTYAGTTLISGGMITVATANSGNSQIGPSSGSVIITNGGTLDIENATANSMSFTNTTDTAGKQFYVAGTGVGGNGAIVNNGTVNQQDAFQNITLTANTTIGGPGRWDMRVPDGKYQPTLDLGGFTLTKTGSNQMSMVSLIVTNGGSIIINNGILSFEVLSSNSTAPITINAGGVLGHFRENATLFTAPITLNGGMIRDLNGTPGATNDSPITLTANSFLDLNVGSTDQLRLNGNITESGGSFGLTKTNIGSFSLAGVNTYSGSTLIVQGSLILANNGSISQSKLISLATNTTFDASQRVDQTLTLNASQTLSGFGSVTGIVSTVSGSTIAPGSASATGTLTFGNNVALAGTSTMKVSHLTVATNDVLSVVNPATLALGGTLNISLLGGTYAGGDTFTLFSAPGGLNGTFAVTNLPALPAGLAWVTTNLVNGVLSIVATVNPNPTNIVATLNGNNLNLSWPADHTGWRLLVQTNALGVGLNPNPADWVTVPGSTSVNSESITIDPTQGTVFYRLALP